MVTVTLMGRMVLGPIYPDKQTEIGEVWTPSLLPCNRPPPKKKYCAEFWWRVKFRYVWTDLDIVLTDLLGGSMTICGESRCSSDPSMLNLTGLALSSGSSILFSRFGFLKDGKRVFPLEDWENNNSKNRISVKRFLTEFSIDYCSYNFW